MRILNVTLILVSMMSAPAFAAGHTCEIASGAGTAYGRGDTPAKALEEARMACGTALIDQYLAARGHIPESVIADLTVSCVNLPCTVAR